VCYPVRVHVSPAMAVRLDDLACSQSAENLGTSESIPIFDVLCSTRISVPMVS
jgi:hypothetical protein